MANLITILSVACNWFSEDLSKLQYTTWCIKESLRRFSPVFNVYRRLTEDFELDGYLVPKGIIH